MSFSNTHELRVTAGGATIVKRRTFTGSQRISVSETVADSVTDGQINVAIDVSAVKSFMLVSDQAVTVETNDGTTPDDTLTLVANEPYEWTENSEHTFLLGTDVTALFVTNASGSTATIQLEAIVDATP